MNDEEPRAAAALPDSGSPSLRKLPSRNLASIESSIPPSRRISKYLRNMSSMHSLQETMKEKLARYKEARENRRSKINSTFKHIFEVLSEKLSLDFTTVEEMILDCPTMEPFLMFFMKGGCKTLKFIYQEGTAPGIECGRVLTGVTKKTKIMRLYVDTAPEELKGLCLFFVRYDNDTVLSAKNISEETLFGFLDASEGFLIGVKNLLSSVFLPVIQATSNWGALNESKYGESEKLIFIETIKRFLTFLDGAEISIEGIVELKKVENIDFSKLRSFDEVSQAAANVEMVHQLEEVLMTWYKQIEQDIELESGDKTFSSIKRNIF